MTNIKSKLAGIVLTLVIAFLAFIIWNYLQPDGMNIPEGMTAEQVDEQRITELLAAGYQVDVYVNSTHSAAHADSSAALRCLNNKGNVGAFSESWSRKLHILCWDEQSQTLFDIIITRIRYEVERFKNPDSRLVTAYAPEGVKGANLAEKMAYYIEHLKSSIAGGGKVVGLHFNPGEIMFIPK